MKDMDLDRVRLQPSRSLGRLRSVLAGRAFRVLWYGLVCGDMPMLTLGLGEGPAALGRFRPGEPLVFCPEESGSEPRLVIELAGEFSELRDWFGRSLVRMRLLQARVGGRRLGDGQLCDFCRPGGWRHWLNVVGRNSGG